MTIYLIGAISLRQAKLETDPDSFDLKLYTPDEEVTFATENEELKTAWQNHIKPLLENGL